MITVIARRAGGLPPARFNDDDNAVAYAKALAAIGVFPVIDNSRIDYDEGDDYA